jgi:formate dehydrogenase alpha subunit
MTVLELARETGIEIPTLCHEPYLKPIGACRLCLVENEASGALLASCVTPITPGMNINTASPRVIEHRKTIVRLMLASHPDSCVVCDKGNRCQLRQIAAGLGIGDTGLERIPQPAVMTEINPYIARDLSKCILCARCIRACQELVVEGVIDYCKRGFKAYPATFGDFPLEKSECTFCGTCVAVCPTGALMEKEKPYQVTARTSVTTTCPFCGCGCSVRLEIKDNKVVRAVPGRDMLSDRGALCVRGSYGYDFIHSADRLTTPLVRDGESLRAASWEEALQKAADGLQRARENYGPDSLAVLGSAKCTNEENYLLQLFARKILGTNNIDNSASLYQEATRTGLGASLGFPGTTNHLGALEQSEVIMAIGTDTTVSAPQVAYAIKRAVKFKKAKLIVIDPRQTKLTAFAQIWLRPRAGTDVALLNALAKVIIDEGLMDIEYVSRKTEDFNVLPLSLEKYTPEFAENVTGVPADDIRQTARLYAAAAKSSIVYGSGIAGREGGVESIKALVNLAELTGNIWCRGCGIYALQRENNAQGAADIGAVPEYLPGYKRLDDTQARRKFEKRWQVNLPLKRGLSYPQVFRQAVEGKIKTLFVVGENPVVSLADTELARTALSSLDFLVVQDLFLTETAKMADVVFPAASFAEKEGTFTNFEGMVGHVRQAVEPPGGSLPDWMILLKLAEAMEKPLPFTNLKQVMEEIEELVPHYEGYYYEEGRSGWEQRRDSCWDSLNGFVRFTQAAYLSEKRNTALSPLTLIVKPSLTHFGSGERTSRSPRLGFMPPENLLSVNPADATELSLSSRERVKIISIAGEAEAVVEIDMRLPPGIVSLPVSFPGINRLFSLGAEGDHGSLTLNTCNVRIERISKNV